MNVATVLVEEAHAAAVRAHVAFDPEQTLVHQGVTVTTEAHEVARVRPATLAEEQDVVRLQLESRAARAAPTVVATEDRLPQSLRNRARVRTEGIVGVHVVRVAGQHLGRCLRDRQRTLVGLDRGGPVCLLVHDDRSRAAHAAAIVVVDHVPKGGHGTVVHIGRGDAHVAQL